MQVRERRLNDVELGIEAGVYSVVEEDRLAEMEDGGFRGGGGGGGAIDVGFGWRRGHFGRRRLSSEEGEDCL